MWAIGVENTGKDSKLRFIQANYPKCTQDGVIIKTHAIGINRADIFQRNGLYPPPSGSSEILGLEVAGVIEKIGSDVKGFSVGDKVCALLEGGGYCEYVAATASQVLPLPANYTFVEGAALPEALFTVYSNFFHHASLAKGNSLLVHGGASGVGTFAIQIAKQYGIACYTTCGSDEKVHFLESLGAKNAINYKTSKFAESIKKYTQGEGVDCIIDIVGGAYFAHNISILAKNGRLICISLLQGGRVEANIAPVIYKNLTILGTTLRAKDKRQKAVIASGLLKDIWPLLEQRKINPIIAEVFDVKEVDEAHKLMISSQHTGKIILKCY